jgi:F-type H+-transporting ATPase subunit epsilon
MAELFLEIITPAKPFFKGVIKSVTVPGTDGGFQVLINHAPILSTIEIGSVKIELLDGTKKSYTVSGGTIEVVNNRVLVLANSIEAIDGIDVDRAKRAAERARKRLADRSDKQIDALRAENALKRALNRLQAVEKGIRSEI